MKSKIIINLLNLVFGLNFFVLSVSGQDVATHSGHEHIHVHDNHKYHLGIGISGTHFIEEKGFAQSFHLHTMKQLGKEKIWGLGLGYEVVVEENLHNTITLMGSYHFFDFISLTAGPGLAFGKHEGERELSPVLHAELVSGFDLGQFHIGPMIGAGIDMEHSHISVGVHAGFGF